MIKLHCYCLQCFDTVGWAAGRASGLQKNGGWWRWTLVSPDGVAPSRMVGVSASVDLPLQQKFSSGTGSPGWSRNKGRKMDVCVLLSQLSVSQSDTAHAVYDTVSWCAQLVSGHRAAAVWCQLSV